MKEFIQELSNDELAEILGAGICICSDGLIWNWCPDKEHCDSGCRMHNGVRDWNGPDSLDRESNPSHRSILGSIAGKIFGSCFK